MGRLDAHNHAGILFGHGGRRRCVHVLQVLLIFGSAHARSHNIQECQHARFGAIDNVRLEVLKVLPPGAAGIGDRGYPRAEGKAIRIYAVVARVGAGFSRARIYMDVNVYQPRGHIEAGDADGFGGERRIDVRGHRGNAMILNGNIHDAVDTVGGIDDVTALQEEVVTLLCLHGNTGHNHDCNCQ